MTGIYRVKDSQRNRTLNIRILIFININRRPSLIRFKTHIAFGDNCLSNEIERRISSFKLVQKNNFKSVKKIK